MPRCRSALDYTGEVVGIYIADMLVNDTVLVEFKVAEEYRKVDFKHLAWNIDA